MTYYDNAQYIDCPTRESNFPKVHICFPTYLVTRGLVIRNLFTTSESVTVSPIQAEVWNFATSIVKRTHQYVLDGTSRHTGKRVPINLSGDIPKRSAFSRQLRDQQCTLFALRMTCPRMNPSHLETLPALQ